jgi:thiamine pyrophosphate-dependent acetolactate synthase large subunit-like protein
MSISGAELIVRHVKAQGMTTDFFAPGANVDRVHDTLRDSSIQIAVWAPIFPSIGVCHDVHRW